MARHQYFRPGMMLLVPVLALLLVAVACGDDATSTPQPTSTPRPTATTAAESTATPTTAAIKPTATTAAATPTRRAPTATPTAAPTPTPAPDFMTASIDRLVAALTTQTHESLLPYEMPTPRSHNHAIFEALLGLDPESGAIIPRLATGWSQSTDGMSWTFNLREGVEFHFGFGEMTNKDLRHTIIRDSSDDSISADASVWRGLIENPEDVELDGDHTAIFRMARPEPDLEFFVSARNGSMSLIQSLAQYDDVGGDQNAIRAKPAGTGAWQLKEHSEATYFLFERVENHWRKTPAFRELQFRYAAEESTRLAMILTGEVHMTDLSRELQQPALERGMARVTAAIPGSGINYLFAGNWFAQPDEIDLDNPLTNAMVREAIVHAINRQEIVTEIFKDRGPVNIMSDWHPAFPGWDDTWDQRAEEKYKFDPELSKQLLTDAGYSDGFDLTIKSHLWPGQPEMQIMDEAIAGYLQDVGINATIETVEYGRTREALRKRESGVWMYAMPPWNLGPPHLSVRCCFASEPKGYLFFFTTPELDALLEELDTTPDLVRRDEIMREMGNMLFDQYMNLSIIQLNQEITIDPSIIKRYPAPGGFTDPFTHTEYIEPVDFL